MPSPWAARIVAAIVSLVFFGESTLADDMKVMPHPRLFLGKEEIARLKEPVEGEPLKFAQETLARNADRYLVSTVFSFDQSAHNSLLIRARNMQGRVVTLLTRWKQTGEDKYRRAAIEHVREMGRWEFWSWDSWRTGDRQPDARYDLSYGENAATLAIAYDWLHATLDAKEKTEFLDLARKWVFGPFLKFSEGQGPHPFWFENAHSNWNTVCAGSAGMLALAMWEETPETSRVLAMAEKSIKPYMATLERTKGGWPEGLGYWNYGMRYAFMYLLSWERATSQKHPLMEQPSTRQTLRFPLDFSPNGVPCSFGDVPRWNPIPFHFAVAERLGAEDVIAGMQPYMAKWKERFNSAGWPEDAELLLMYPRKEVRAQLAIERDVARIYPELDWCILADRLPAPTMYMAARGGTTKIPHSHLDLLSFFITLGDEAMITNLGNAEYMDTTFSSRRWELFEMTPASKNSILINGVGITIDSSVTTEAVEGKTWKGIRMDATAAMGRSRGPNAATFCGRLFVMFPGKGFLVLDRVETPHSARVETRMHTLQKAEFAESSVLLKGVRQQMRVVFACDVPAVLRRSEHAMTAPIESNPTAIRWCTRAISDKPVTMAAFLSPGEAPATVEIATDGEKFLIKLRKENWQEEIRVDTRLR